VLVNLNPKKIPVFVAVGAIVWWVVKDSEAYLNVSGLGPTNTVYDFQTASQRAKEHFLSHKCNNGVCQSIRDWECGYEVDDNNGFRVCFLSELERNPAWEELGSVLKRCGKNFQHFTGLYGDPARCKELSTP
jgi:hypothetical protein